MECTLFGLQVDGVLADSDASDDGVRLPTIAAPSSYRLTLLPIMDGPHQRLCGHVRLIFEALRPSTRLILHAFDLRVLEAVYRVRVPPKAEIIPGIFETQITASISQSQIVVESTLLSPSSLLP